MTLKNLLIAAENFEKNILDLVDEELDEANIHDINSTQAVLLLRLGDEEMTVGNLAHTSCYLGSNVSYNIKALVDRGYLIYRPAPTDRRSRLVKATKRGLAIAQLVSGVEGKCADRLESFSIPLAALQGVTDTLVKANKVLG